MNRELKFRAWTGKEMVLTADFFDEHADWGQGFLRAIKLDQGDGSYELIPLMQFTGLKDKNGKDIYEGDLVFYEDHEWEVVWEYDRWDMKNGDTYVRDHDFPDDPGTTFFENALIIGNVFENPQML